MKKLFIVFGKNSEDIQRLISRMMVVLMHDNCITVYADRDDDHEALEETLDAIRARGGCNNDNTVVYAGDNLTLLKANIPCACIDLAILKDKVTEGAGGESGIPLTEYLAETMLEGALLSLMNDNKRQKQG